MASEPPQIAPAQLVDALQRLDADLLAGWATVGSEAAREHLRDRIRRLQASLNAEAISQFAQEQEDTTVAMALLLDEWAAMLAALHEIEVAATRT
jgi:hypothetical protein